MAKDSPLLRQLMEFRSHMLWDGIKEIVVLLVKTAHIWVPFALPVVALVALFVLVKALIWIAKLIKRHPGGTEPAKPSAAEPAETGLSIDGECSTTTAAQLQLTTTHASNHSRVTRHHVRHEVKFISFKTGEVVRNSGLSFSVSDGAITGARPSTSLMVSQEAVLGLVVRWGGKFYTISQWPFKHENEDELTSGEWKVEVSIRDDSEKDRDLAIFRAQFHSDGSSHWIRVTQAAQPPVKRLLFQPNNT